jgi:hypothetical protein
MTTEADDGVSAIQTIIAALKPLDEGTRQNVLDFVLKQLSIKLVASGPASAAAAGPGPVAYESAFPTEAPSRGDTAEPDIRSLAEKKQPKTVNDKVAVLAYYLKSLAPAGERRDYITTEDITNYFPAADFELPVAPRMALTNAKNAGYLHSLGNGQFRLNPVGHNLVTHKLPIGEKKRAKRSTPKKRR